MLSFVVLIGFVVLCMALFIATSEAWKYLYPIMREKKASKFRFTYCVGFFTAFCSLACIELLYMAGDLGARALSYVGDFIAVRKIWQSSKRMQFLKEGFNEGSRVWNIDVIPNPCHTKPHRYGER